MLNRWVIVYIDDVLIYSDSYEDHVQHVRVVLQRLIANQLYAKTEKCEFHQSTVSFLGYVISSGGVAMDERKVRAVVNWPRPLSVKELQRFLGFANFYRRFIRNFSTVAAPLTSMSKKGPQRLVWTPRATSAFQELRKRFTTAPILHHPDPELEFIVEVDASSTGIGAVLYQRQGDPLKTYPCAFYSRKLNPAEQNYDVGYRELLSMKAAFEEWRHWLEGAKHPFTVLTDHRNLEYLRSAKRLNHRQARWALFFIRFDFTVTYRPGSLNTKADVLSRQYESSLLPPTKESIISPALIVAPIQWDIMTEISEAQITDPPPAESPPNLTYVPLFLFGSQRRWSLSLPVLTLIFPALLPCLVRDSLCTALQTKILWINRSLNAIDTIETWVSGNLTALTERSQPAIRWRVGEVANRVSCGSFRGGHWYLPFRNHDNRYFADWIRLYPGLSKNSENGNSCPKPHKAARMIEAVGRAVSIETEL